MSLYFHFTLGPVQGFVAQARRTRDFWAGSFILSWLSAVAMKAVKKNGGNIKFPKADKDFLKWLEGKGTEGKPVQGSVPNRFKAEVGAGFNPEVVVDAVNAAWEALADEIYKKDLQPVVTNGSTREIWDRQIKGFWEINWVIRENEKDSTLLDRRKNWRSHLPPDEPGLKCMMMDGWQELSGVEKPGREALDKFWGGIREKGRNGIKSDIRESEHLCAIAFVKRRFSRWFDNVEKDMNGWALKGWNVPDGVPSVAYMAAARWLGRVAEKAGGDDVVKDNLLAFHKVAYDLTKEYGEWNTQLKCIPDIETLPDRKWKAIDGNMFFQSMLENPHLYDLDAAKPVVNALKELRKNVQLEPVSPFYAILLMDGDSLGKQMGDLNNQTIISDALAKFTKRAPDIVVDNSGFLIYAGGDDVLAVLPLEDALPCAVALREWYMECFEEKKESKVQTSISGAIQYAHIKMPLTKVLRDAHDLLDNVAKDGRGRDAIAVRVWKPGGKALEWAQPWKIALKSGNIVLAELAENLAPAGDNPRQYSSKFFYKIRQKFDLLNPMEPGVEPVLKPPQDVELMASEYLASGLCEHIPKEKRIAYAEEMVERILRQCRPRIRVEDESDSDKWKQDPNLYADGALLVRFLASKGV